MYCGEIGSTQEHFPPRVSSDGGYIFPACSECNLFAGTNHPFNFEERCSHVRERIRSRYWKVLNAPVWTEEEISELGYNLAVGIKAWMKLRQTVERRLAWDVTAYLASRGAEVVFTPDGERKLFTLKSRGLRRVRSSLVRVVSVPSVSSPVRVHKSEPEISGKLGEATQRAAQRLPEAFNGVGTDDPAKVWLLKHGYGVRYERHLVRFVKKDQQLRGKKPG